MTKLCIDLCAGLKGFSQAFEESKEWEVITLEINKKQKPTIQADVKHLPLRPGLDPEVLLASPPCNHFSLACLQFPRKGVKNALEIVGACFEAVAILKPKYWFIENPRGRLRGIIGKPKTTIRYSDYDSKIKMMKTTDFWGNIQLPMVKHERRIKLSSGMTRIERLKKHFPHETKQGKAERAKVPYGVSKAVFEGVKTSLDNSD